MMSKQQKLFGFTMSALIIAGCGTTPQAAAPQATGEVSQAALTTLPADASVMNAETGYAVQQMGDDMYDNDGRVRLAMRGDNDNRYRYDDDDDRLRRLRPRFESLLFQPHRFLITPFHRTHPIFINVHRQRVFRLNPSAFFILKRIFPQLSDLELRLLIQRLIITRHLNVRHQRFPIFVVPFNRAHDIRFRNFDRDHNRGRRDNSGPGSRY